MDLPGIITLRGNRPIQIQELRQRLVYAGLLEGVPFDKMNQRIVDSVLAEARALAGSVGEPYLIRPLETPLDFPRNYPFGKPARLPAVCCIARCTSEEIEQHDVPHRSWLTIVWFQEGYAYPIQEYMLAELTQIDWEKRALDQEM